MNLFIAGGTGLVGSHTVQRLLRDPSVGKITVGTRSPQRRAVPDSRVTLVRADVGDPVSLEQATRGQEVMIHCVQFPNHPIENRWRGWTYLKVDGEGTVRLVEAAKKNGVRRFIYLSGAGAGRGRKEPWFRAKAMAEEAIMASGMEYVIFRNSWTYGPGDHSINRFVLFARLLPFLPVIGDGKSKVQPVFVKDVAEAIARAVSSPRATNQIFELGGPEEFSMDEIMRTVLRVLGKRRFLLHHPSALMKLITFFLQFLPFPPLTPGAIDFLTMENRVDSTAAIQALDLKLFSLEDGLRTYLR